MSNVCRFVEARSGWSILITRVRLLVVWINAFLAKALADHRGAALAAQWLVQTIETFGGRLWVRTIINLLVERIFASQTTVVRVPTKVFALWRLWTVVSSVVKIWFDDVDGRAHTRHRW
jgi:hypothetical protein